MSSRPAPAPLRAEALHAVGARLRTDENFARMVRKDPRRALGGLEFLTDRERRGLLGEIDDGTWKKLAEASDRFRVAGGERALAGLPDVVKGPSDWTGGFDPGGWGRGGEGDPGGGGEFGDLGNLLNPGGSGGVPQFPGTPGSGGPDVSGFGGGPDGGAMVPSGGNAMDPRSPTGGKLGRARPGSSGGPFSHDPSGFGTVGRHGDPDGGGGISGGRLPSRAVLAGSAWKALHPGRDVSDDPSPPPKRNDGGAPDGGAGGGGATPGAPDSPPSPAGTNTPAMTPAGPDAMTPPVVNNKPAPGTTPVEIGAMVLLGVIGGTVGSVVGLRAGGEFGSVLVGLGGAVGGGYAGYRIAHHFGWMPADDAVGGSGGGPRSNVYNRFVGANGASGYVPADDGSSGSGRGPRSNVYMPADDGYGGTGGGPRSLGGVSGVARRLAVTTARALPDSPWASVSKPNPDDPSSPGPRSSQ